MPNQRNWCFTAWEEPDFSLNNCPIRYMIYGLETCPDTGRLHFQGYVEFDNKVSMRFVKDVFSDNTMHLAARRGTQQQAIDYCMKEGNYTEYGKPQYSGKRNDLKDVIDECKNVEEVMDRYPHIYCAYRNGLKDIYNKKACEQIPSFRKVNVEVYIGKTGSGKTRRAVEENEGKYYKLSSSGSALWFDGYCNQEVLIIDEFYGWIKWNFLLQILDGYRLQLPIKGGFVQAAWTKVVITSNKDIDAWYPNIKDISALRRRISKVEMFGVDCDVEHNGSFIFSSVTEVYNGPLPSDFKIKREFGDEVVDLCDEDDDMCSDTVVYNNNNNDDHC